MASTWEIWIEFITIYCDAHAYACKNHTKYIKSQLAIIICRIHRKRDISEWWDCKQSELNWMRGGSRTFIDFFEVEIAFALLRSTREENNVRFLYKSSLHLIWNVKSWPWLYFDLVFSVHNNFRSKHGSWTLWLHMLQLNTANWKPFVFDRVFWLFENLFSHLIQVNYVQIRLQLGKEWSKSFEQHWRLMNFREKKESAVQETPCLHNTFGGN